MSIRSTADLPVVVKKAANSDVQWAHVCNLCVCIYSSRFC